MTPKIDWTRPIETTDGRPAKVLPYEPKYSTCRAVAVPNDGGEWLYVVRDNGTPTDNTGVHFRNVRREPKDIWVNEYGETWYECRGFGTKETTVKDAENSKMYGFKPFRVAVHYREVIEEEK